MPTYQRCTRRNRQSLGRLAGIILSVACRRQVAQGKEMGSSARRQSSVLIPADALHNFGLTSSRYKSRGCQQVFGR